MGSTAALLVVLMASLAPVARADARAAIANPDVRSGFGVQQDATPTGDAGFLTVTTDPAAKLEIDGKDTGMTTPVSKLSLAAGKHKVTLTSLDGKTKRTLGVTIVAGEEKRLSVTL